MTHAPFAVPRTLAPDLDRVRAYWEGLKRGAADMPFWDDANLTALPDLAGRLMLLDVLGAPERFRFAIVGEQISDAYGESVAGRFIDEIVLKAPFEHMRSQCAATIEAAAPTYFQAGVQSSSGRGYGRLLLPMWGEGRIGMLLGAIDWR